MTYKSDLGQFGENLAREYLVKKGYKIISRNVRQKWGELDIIAKAPDRTLVFVEVKTLRQAQGKPAEEMLQPEDELTQSKLEKLKRTASLYAGHYPEKIDDSKGWRIDLLALVVSGRDYNIKHYENIG